MSNLTTYSQLSLSGLNKMAISRRVHNHTLGNLGYGFFTENPKILKFENDNLMIKINNLMDKFPVPPNRLIFSSISLNFCINQLISTTTYVVEVEKEYLQTIFELLRSNFSNVVLLKPNMNDKINYWAPNSIYIVELFKRSPINKDGTITIEKLVVDLLFDKKIYFLYSGQDIDSAIDILCSKYTINFKTLFAYAARKGKKKQLLDRIRKYIPHEILKMLDNL